MAKITATPGFEQRIAISEKFEDVVEEGLKASGFSVVPSGTEHTYPDFIEELRLSTDPNSLFLRFEPDFAIHTAKEYDEPPISCCVEAKAGKKLTIEKTAYEQYMKRVSLGQLIAVVFECENNEILWNFVEDIVLIPGEKTVSVFLPERRFAVIDGWICPRETPYGREVLRKNPRMSGTPLRYVNSQSLLPWADFKQRFFEKQSLS